MSMGSLGKIRRLTFRHLGPDIFAILLSLYLSLWLRVSPSEFSDFSANLTRYLPLILLIKISVFVVSGLYDIMWRYISVQDTLKIGRAVGLSTLAVLIVALVFGFQGLPRSLFFIDSVVLVLALSGLRVSWRIYLEEISKRTLRSSGRRALIVGAGANGRALLGRFQNDVRAGVSVVGFVDDDPRKHGIKINGVTVLGGRGDLSVFLKHHQIQDLFIAMPLAEGKVLNEVLNVCRPFGIHPKVTTPLGGRGGLGANASSPLRGLSLEDLLVRKPRIMDVSSLQDLVRGRRVLVTGAGGSIGSEIVRQVMALGPSKMLLLDHSEFNLYSIDQEIRANLTPEEAAIIPLLVDLKDGSSLERVMKENMPEIIFHAAAYKHVHLVELNPFSAILNNILGLSNLLYWSEELKVGTFVLISTDKAVNPAGVMGATKRLSELMVTSFGKRTGARFCAVRFGNVLGSSGSLIPLLARQIESGAPVTITHPDVTRYFMLIPEAVSLVLKAAAISKPGDIMVLRMGEPLRVQDIARSLISLMGRSENEVPIVYTGLRPGEKMFEELYLSGKEVETSDPDILVLPRGDFESVDRDSLPEIETRAALLIELARKSDREALLLLAEIVRNYGGTIPGGLTAGAQFLETHDLDVSDLGKDPRDLH